MITETRVTIARHDKKQDLDIIIHTFGGPRKLMQRYKTSIVVVRQLYSPTFHRFQNASRPSLLLDPHMFISLLIRWRYLPISLVEASSSDYSYVNI